MDKLLLLITTESNQISAERISKLLIENRLAACVSVKKINSYYQWQGEIEQNSEFQLVIKSKPEKLDDLIKVLRKNLSYEIPQLIYQTFDAEINYLNWVREILS